jgi:hypothetical protein
LAFKLRWRRASKWHWSHFVKWKTNTNEKLQLIFEDRNRAPNAVFH